MPQVIDTPEEIEAHKTHIIPQPDICDLCWIEAPFNEEELKALEEEDLNV